jgi:hypothetical protein
VVALYFRIRIRAGGNSVAPHRLAALGSQKQKWVFAFFLFLSLPPNIFSKKEKTISVFAPKR